MPKSEKPAKKTAAKKPKQKVGRKCSVCFHPAVDQINAQIVDGVSFRTISRQVTNDEKMRAAFQRHAENCLKIELAALIQRKKEEQAINVYTEFEENLAFARMLRTAAYEYLSDPIDPLKISIIPFAHEIDVSYFDNTDLTEGRNPKPKKKSSKLDMLLAQVEQLRNLDVDKVSIKHVDLRSFAIECIRAVDTCVDKFAKIGGEYFSDKETARREANAVKAIKDFLTEHPGMPKDQVIDAFSAGRNIPRERLADQLGVIG